MVKVLGHWEIGYMTPIQEQYYWSLVMRDFEVKDWNMTPVSGIRNRERGVDLTEHANYQEFFDQVDTSLKRVFIEPRTNHQNPDTIWLHEFDHPEDCIYIFGSAHYNPTIHHRREIDDVVSVKTLQDKGVLWSNQCLALILYDRMMKNNKL